MEKSLGKIIKGHRVKAPFDGMESRQKVKFSSICKTIMDESRGGGKFGIRKSSSKIFSLQNRKSTRRRSRSTYRMPTAR